MAPPNLKQVVPEGRNKETMPTTPGALGKNDKADPNVQLRQVKAFASRLKLLNKNTRWAIGFFKQKPEIQQIAKAVSIVVDVSIKAANRWFGSDQLSPVPSTRPSLGSEIANRILANRSRDKIDSRTKLMLKSYSVSSHVKHRIPRPLAAAEQMAKLPYGRCEEHALLALYLLTTGHMAQGQPFGRLKNDIYYTGAGTSDHAMAILVKGSEFKEFLKKKMDRRGIVDIKWIMHNTNQWGKSAWIVDGWNSKNVKRLAVTSPKFDFIRTQTFRRDVLSGLKSPWDLNVEQMVKRIAKDYRL